MKKVIIVFKKKYIYIVYTKVNRLYNGITPFSYKRFTSTINPKKIDEFLFWLTIIQRNMYFEFNVIKY